MPSNYQSMNPTVTHKARISNSIYISKSKLKIIMNKLNITSKNNNE